MASAPELAAAARRLLRRGEIDEGLLATVRGDALPRVNPVYVGFVEGHLLTVALAGSAKLRDLREDGRFALHSHQDPAAPSELLLRGRAVEVDRPAPGRRSGLLVVRHRRRRGVRPPRRPGDPRRASRRGRLAAALPQLARPGGRLTRLSLPGILEHDDLARRLPGPQPVEGVVELVSASRRSMRRSIGSLPSRYHWAYRGKSMAATADP